MRALVLAAAVTALGAAPAFAQGSPASSHNGGTSAQASVPMREKLTQDLARAGFTNITVAPEAFAVHATNSEGQRVFMLVSPDSVTEIAPAPGTAAGHATTMKGTTKE